MGPLGFVNPEPPLGDSSILVRPARSIGQFVAQVTLEETHRDEMIITEHPVEQGAAIADHAYKRPAELTIKCAWSNSKGDNAPQSDAVLQGNSPEQIKDIYAKFLELQASREPFEVVTGKRIYTNMLIQSCTVTTSKEFENSLQMTVMLRQVIIVSTRVVNVSAPTSAQKQPEVTDPPVVLGAKMLRSESGTERASQLTAEVEGTSP